MQRRGILETTKEVLSLLKEKEYTINEISTELKVQWKTAIKILEFLEEIGLVKERKGKKTYKEERLFKIANKK